MGVGALHEDHHAEPATESRECLIEVRLGADDVDLTRALHRLVPLELQDPRTVRAVDVVGVAVRGAVLGGIAAQFGEDRAQSDPHATIRQ